MEIGTLWFGADIDLTKLQQKIQSGNKSILDALKINYDPQSYNQMVTKLRSQLDNEVFKIKVSTDTSAVRQNLQNTLNGIASSVSMPNLNLGQMKGIPAMKMSAAQLTEEIVLQTEKVRELEKAWKAMKTLHGKESMQAKAAYTSYNNAVDKLNAYKTTAGLLGVDIKKASVAQSELNRQQKEATKIAKQWNSDSLRLNTTLAGGVHISTQLGSALSSLFAIDYARQFLGNVIEIGGQLEKQRISIGAILGDTVKATHLFEQIKGLALKSPFGVVELDQYTKQLSAYGFKYSELFDMTKRLADISAGAGTDIGRLTLALGHVRSATYLTGITLRQFSMNNIPMLKMLADYYSEVEKRAVSTAEVQQRISKRQVSYEDVIEQIRRLTNEGGMFYNMQEKISESLAARFKNLRDAMDIMYGEMAEGTIGDMLKELAAVLLQTTRHWKEIGAVMGVAAAAFMFNKIAIGLNTVTMNNNTASTLRQIMATKRLEADNLRVAATYRKLSIDELRKLATEKQLTAAEIQMSLATEKLTKDEVLNAIALKKMTADEARALIGMELFTKEEINAALAANALQTRLSTLGMKIKNIFTGIGWGTWATIGTMVGVELFMAYNEWADRIDDKAKEMQDLIKSRVIDLEKVQKKIDSENRPTDKTALKGQIDDMKQVLANSEAYTKTIDEQLSKATDLNKQYDILKTAIGDAAEKNKKMLDYQEQIGHMIKASSIGAVDGIFNHGLTDFPLLRYFFNDDISQNMKQTLNTYKDLRIAIDNAWEYKDAIKGVIDEMIKSGEISGDFAERLKNAPFEEQIRLLAESRYWDKITGQLISTDVRFANFADKLKLASNGVTDRWEEIINDDIPNMMKKAAKDRGIQEKDFNKWCLDNVDDFKMMLESLADQLDIKEPEIRRNLKRLFYDYVRLQNLAEQMNGNEGMAAGALVGASLFSNEKLRKLLDEDELADIKDNNKGDTTNKEKRDAQLEVAKTKLAQYKAFLSEYKKYREMYSREKALNILETLFPDLKDDKGNFLGNDLIDNYTSVLNKLRGSLELNTEARKKWANEIDKTNADTLFDRQKEAMDQNVKDINDYTKRLEEQWKNYRDIMKKTGGREDIAQMAFSDGNIWDEASRKLLENFNRIGKERGVIPVNFNWNLNEVELEKALGKENKDLIALAKKIQDIIKGNYKNFLSDTADAYSKSLSEAEKLNELLRQRRELEEKIRNANSEDQKSGFRTQAKALDNQIAAQKWEAFKETNEWGRIFANLDNITTHTLNTMLEKIRAIAPELKVNEEIIKQIYEAIDKMEIEAAKRNPFATIFNPVQKASRLRQLLKAEGISNGFTPMDKKTAQYYGLQEGRTYSKEYLQDLLKQAENDFSKGVEALSTGFKALQDTLSPVIDLFDTLGNEDLSNLFSIGSNAFGAAANTANGLKALGLESLGPYGAAAAAGVSLVSSLFALGDKNLQKEIEASQARQKEMSNLTENIERILKRTLGGQYNLRATEQSLRDLQNVISNQYIKRPLSDDKEYYTSKETKEAVKNAEKTKTYYDYTYASLLAQRDEVAHQMETEKKKKKSDAVAIQNYKKDLAELDDEIKNFAIDMANALYSIDIKSWASQLGDALFEAWQKGESGAEAFKKKASELIAELSKNIATTKLIETAMQPVLDIIVSEMKRTKGMLDEKSVSDISEKMAVISNTLPDSFNKLMDALNEGIKKAGLTDMKKLAEDTESATQNGIGKAITEQDTSLWSSYINAIRLDTSVIRATEAQHLPIISVAAQRVSVLAETQVAHLQQIADNTKRNADAADRIYDIMRKIDNGTTKLTIK